MADSVAATSERHQIKSIYQDNECCPTAEDPDPSCAATLRRGERYRGASSISFAPPPRRRVDARAWRTTNQAMRPRASVVATTGLDNPGISSSLAKRVHASQRA